MYNIQSLSFRNSFIGIVQLSLSKGSPLPHALSILMLAKLLLNPSVPYRKNNKSL